MEKISNKNYKLELFKDYEDEYENLERIIKNSKIRGDHAFVDNY